MTDEERAEMHKRLTKLEVGQTSLETEMRTNTRVTNSLQTDVTEVLDILATAKQGFKVLGVLGNVIKWTASIVAACGALYAAVHGGMPK